MISHLLFDLDNTLYSARYGLEDNVSQRVHEFLVKVFGMTPEEAAQARKEQAGKYGTTLEWLMVEKGFTDPEAYLEALHPENEADPLPPDPELGDFFASIPLPKAILTNSQREHVDRILSKLGISGHFGHVFDLRFNDFKGKPRPAAFLRALDVMGARPETTLFVDDSPRFAESFLALGGKALLMDEFEQYSGSPCQRIKDIREIKAFLSW